MVNGGEGGYTLIKRFEVDFNRQQSGRPQGGGGRGCRKPGKELRVTANDTLM